MESLFSDRRDILQRVFRRGDWEPWIKPRGISTVRIFGFGGGGSGAGGFQAASGTQRGGGGGGSSGSVSHLIIPASNLPDVLYVLAGAGGAAVAGNTAGNAGGNSFVSIQPNSTTNNICFRAEGGTAGAVGTVSTGGVAGAAPAATTVGNMFLSYSGQKELLVGFAGATGGISAQGNSVNFGGGCVMGGAGGGGTTSGNVDGSGGTVNGSGIFPQVLGGPGGSGAAGGTDGRMIHQPGQFPFVSTGGTGGGAAGAGTASAGGNGGPGSGGGGGGAGVTAGGGGAGGNGIIWIICW